MQSKPKPSILIVEDEGIVAADIEDRLKRMGYRVNGIAATGTQAIQMTETTQPDLVLMDIILKGPLDGVQAADIIRGKFKVPVVFLTANSDQDTLDRAKVTEPFGFLLKPFDERDLEITIEVGLYKHQRDQERVRLLLELQQTLSRVKTLSGLLPICTGCKKIRDDSGYWQRVEDYISTHSCAEFSHGMCPDCLHRLYPDIAEAVMADLNLTIPRAN